MLFLKIENPGVAPIEGLTLLGVSTTDSTNESQTIGMFGSGIKQGINVLLRNCITPIFYIGNLRLHFFTKPKVVNDGISVKEYNQVCYRVTGKHENKQYNKEVETSWVREYGQHDWTEIAQAMREFVSNAIDRAFRETENTRDVKIEVVDDDRAKSGFTRIFIPLTPEVQRYSEELRKRFLHFEESDKLSETVLDKRCRQIKQEDCHEDGASIYKKGVYVRTTHHKSLFDYNLQELKLDESRNADEYQVKEKIGHALRDAKPQQLAKVFLNIQSKEVDNYTVESDVSSYDLIDRWVEEDIKNRRRENWQEAWKLAYGDNAIPCHNLPIIVEQIRKKGYVPIIISYATWFEALSFYGISSYSSILNEDEIKGIQILQPNETAIAVTHKIWNLFEDMGMTKNKSFPSIKLYKQVINPTLGMYREGVVYLNADICDGTSDMLLQTALEELVHHVTGSTDCSRDFQEFLLQLSIKMWRNTDVQIPI